MNSSLREKRRAMGLSQQQLADLAQMKLHAYNKKELGLRRITDRESARFARILGCPVEQIIERES